MQIIGLLRKFVDRASVAENSDSKTHRAIIMVGRVGILVGSASRVSLTPCMRNGALQFIHLALRVQSPINIRTRKPECGPQITQSLAC